MLTELIALCYFLIRKTEVCQIIVTKRKNVSWLKKRFVLILATAA